MSSKTFNYVRPQTLQEALAYRADTATTYTVLAGGTELNPGLGNGPVHLLDLQALELNTIEPNTLEGDGARVTLGAMVTLQQMADAQTMPALLRTLAQHEQSNTFRNQATIGGLVASAHAESHLLAALLAWEASITLATPQGEERVDLATLFADPEKLLAGTLLTAVTFHRHGTGASERVARTPRDTPIVAAAGRRGADGQIRIALCGVADRPIEVREEALDALTPPSDFRSSSDYRRQMARVVYTRVATQLTRSGLGS